ESHNVPEDKAVVIPNFVDTEKLARQKIPEANKSIGFVDIVPRSKRLDRALDVLEGLLEKDPEFQLRIKGKTPEDYPWMKNRPEELEFYDAQYRRIDQINKIFPNSVVFDGFGNDMDEWYSKVGIVLSTSDFESFHLTIADGAASGAIPALLYWPGADMICSCTWRSGTTQALVSTILEGSVDPDEAKIFVNTSLNLEEQLCKFTAILLESMY